MHVKHPRHLSDWVGFIFFSALAAITLSRQSAISVLLLPTILFELLVAISFLIREPPRAALQTAGARLTAHSGTFLIIVFVQIARDLHPEWLAPTHHSALRGIGALLWLTGFVWATYSIWHLRRAFSIEPQARQLVTSGPYRITRHPIYAGYSLQYIGMWLLFPTTTLGLVVIAWFMLTAARIQLEEKVLDRAFPEHMDYRTRVAVLKFLRPRPEPPRHSATACVTERPSMPR